MLTPHATVTDFETVVAVPAVTKGLLALGMPPQYEWVVAPVVGVLWNLLLASTETHASYGTAALAGLVLGATGSWITTGAKPVAGKVRARVTRQKPPQTPATVL